MGLKIHTCILFRKPSPDSLRMPYELFCAVENALLLEKMNIHPTRKKMKERPLLMTRPYLWSHYSKCWSSSRRDGHTFWGSLASIYLTSELGIRTEIGTYLSFLDDLCHMGLFCGIKVWKIHVYDGGVFELALTQRGGISWTPGNFKLHAQADACRPYASVYCNCIQLFSTIVNIDVWTWRFNGNWSVPLWTQKIPSHWQVPY